MSTFFRFPGQESNEDPELYYNMYRHYNPELGRYMSADPIGLAGGINHYSYVGNNPINYIDPWGFRRRGFRNRTLDYFYQTNAALPGALAPPLVSLITAGGVAKYFNLPTALSWIRNGFRGLPSAGVVFTGLGTGVLVGAGITINFVVAGASYEAGVLIGSGINAGYDMYREKYPIDYMKTPAEPAGHNSCGPQLTPYWKR